MTTQLLALPHLPARPNETHERALRRMAVNAAIHNIRVLYRDVAGFWHVSSGSGPVPYLVTGSGSRCECAGFARYGRCTHLAAVLDHIGRMPAIESSEALAA